MKYIVLYRSDNGKNYFERVIANSPKDAEMKVRYKYNDITEIVDVREDH